MYKDPPLGLRGFLIDAPECGALRALRDGAVIIEDGCIAEYGEYETLRAKHSSGAVRWAYSPETVIIPGLVGIHTHLPQYPAVARVEASLLPWLERHIFPLERGFNAAAARSQAPAFFEALARHGTTCAVVYTAVYAESCDVAFSAAERSGLRIVMGKMMMDVGSYDSLRKEKILDRSCSESESLCRKWHGRDNGRLEYAFSPRFVITCSEEMMRSAARLAEQYGAYIQTHLSESLGEIEAVKKLFPQFGSYTEVYGQCGLLEKKSLLGHCIHLTDGEIARLAETDSVAAHCPTSNFFLTSGLMPMDRLRAAGVRIALGSDVAGGPELHMWQVMRSAIEAQKARHFHDVSVPVPTVAEVFYLATHGGAHALGKSGLFGTLDVGREADLVALDLASAMPGGRKTNLHASVTAEDVLACLVYRGGAANVIETFVRGKSVYKAPAPLLL